MCIYIYITTNNNDNDNDNDNNTDMIYASDLVSSPPIDVYR